MKNAKLKLSVPVPSLSSTLARIHRPQAQCLTLPDFYGKAWGPAVEVLVSLLTCISFICLLAGNLVRRRAALCVLKKRILCSRPSARDQGEKRREWRRLSSFHKSLPSSRV